MTPAFKSRAVAFTTGRKRLLGTHHRNDSKSRKPPKRFVVMRTELSRAGFFEKESPRSPGVATSRNEASKMKRAHIIGEYRSNKLIVGIHQPRPTGAKIDA